jgi:TolB-like protein/DNA-binding winged helix-turn-helix (wHTH) protein/Tfp pilus assembly protein PilF
MARWVFGAFALDSDAFELRRHGEPVRIEQHPLDLLIVLVENHGQLVPREQLAAKLWGPDVFVDTELGINTAIRKIRLALDDDPNAPRFVQTVVGKGYRFIAQIDAPVAETPAAVPAVATGAAHPRSRPWRRPLPVVIAAALVLIAGVGFVLWSGWTAPPTRTVRSVAVLPLQNLSGDPNQDYLADGMTDLLITQLAKISGLQVVSRTTVARYRQRDKTAREIAGELNVDALIEGSVVRADGRIRITAQLIDAGSDRHIWADEYESDIQAIIPLQGEVARDIARELHVRLTTAESTRLAATSSIRPEALEQYVRGRAAFERWTDASTTQAREYFQRAMDIDPSYAEAYAAMAETYVFGPDYFRALGENGAVARRFAERALEIDPQLGSAHAAVAQVQFVVEWNWDAAGDGFRRAIELSPNNQHIRHLYSHFLISVGRYRESQEHVNRMLLLEPLSASSFNHLSYHHLKAGAYDLAVQAAERALTIQPNYAAAMTSLALAHIARKDYGKATDAFATAYRLSGRTKQEIDQALSAYRRGGWTAFVEDDLKQSLDSIRADEKAGKPTNDTRTWGIAQDYALLGRTDEAFAWLEKCFSTRCSRMTELREDETLGSIRSDPRYKALERRLGLISP